jgi:hypothetical protein
VYKFFVIGRICADSVGKEVPKAEKDASCNIAMFLES